MTLIACPRCRQTISGESAVCIHCGRRIDAGAERIDYVTGERLAFTPRPAAQLAARPPRYPTRAGMRLMLAGSGLVILGSFLPWVRRGDLTVSGLDADGPITLALGIALILLVISARASQSTVPRLLIRVGAFAAILVALFDSSRLMETGFHRQLMGPGLLIVLLGAIVAIIGSTLLER